MADAEDIKQKTRQIYEFLPHLDDQRCGYRTCGEFARAVAEGKAPCDGCIMGGDEVSAKVCQIMGVPRNTGNKHSLYRGIFQSSTMGNDIDNNVALGRSRGLCFAKARRMRRGGRGIMRSGHGKERGKR